MDELRFRLEVIETNDEWVVVCGTPFGRATRKLPSPFSGDSLSSALFAVEKALIRSTSPVITRRAAPAERVVYDFGAGLTDAVLNGDVRILFDRCRAKSRELKAPMRILLTVDGPNVARIPWEFTVDPDSPDDYLALRVPIVRSPQLMEPVPPLCVDPPLKVLGVISRPADLPTLDNETERQEISRTLGNLSSDLVDITWLPGDRWRDLAEALRSQPWHVLHFIGHGGFDEETCSGYLELSDDAGNAIAVPATDIGRLVADNPALRLVLLNACESATSGPDGPLSSTAAKLLHAGVPAVVAMQYEISDPAALAFAASFYQGIAHGLHVDRAVTLAREEVKMSLRSLEWATPVLFLASDETLIFTVPSDGRAADKLAMPPPVVTAYPATHPSFLPPPAPPPAPAPQQSKQDPELPPQARKVGALPSLGPCTSAHVGPADLVAVALSDGTIRVASARGGRLGGQCRLPGGERAVRLAWSPWPRHVASQHEGGLAVVWDLETEVPVRAISTQSKSIDGLAFSADGKWLAALSGRNLCVWNTAGERVRNFSIGDGGRHDVLPTAPVSFGPLAFAPGDKRLIVAADDGVVRAFDTHGQLGKSWPHPGIATAFAAGTTGLVTGTSTGRVSVWHWDGRLLRRVQQAAAIAYVAVSKDCSRVASLGSDGSLWLWDAEGHALAQSTVVGTPAGLGFLADGATVATICTTGDVELWSGEAA